MNMMKSALRILMTLAIMLTTALRMDAQTKDSAMEQQVFLSQSKR
jgi:hypothetical protein